MTRERRSILTALLIACTAPGALAAGIDPDDRPANLDLPAWLALSDAFREEVAGADGSG